MINEKHFQEAIAKYIPFVSIERGTEAAAAVFELAKQMAKEQNAELLQALDKCVRYFEMHRNGGCNGEGRKPEAGSSYEVAKNLLAEYSGTPASSLAQEAEGKWISVKERLPEIKSKKDWIGVEVLALCQHGLIKAKYSNNGFTEVASFGSNSSVSVTHWQPFPKLPSPPSSNKIN